MRLTISPQISSIKRLSILRRELLEVYDINEFICVNVNNFESEGLNESHLLIKSIFSSSKMSATIKIKPNRANNIWCGAICS